MGEAIVILQDVEVLLSCRVDELSITLLDQNQSMAQTKNLIQKLL